MSVLGKLFKNLALKCGNPFLRTLQVNSVPARNIKVRPIYGPKFDKPKPGAGQLRRRVHFQEEYTVEPLKVTNLAGRDPVTGRLVHKGIGGGIKHKYHQIQWLRDGPTEDVQPRLEKVIQILKCGCRNADVALVAVEDQMKYIIASVNMKAGDILKTSRYIPQFPVKPNEGDAYCLGALPVGTQVHNVELSPYSFSTMIRSAGCFGTIKKSIDGLVVVLCPGKRKQQYALSPKCMATVGQVSNVEFSSTPIGSAARARELGFRPRSGLWQRKTGRFGRKIKPPPKLRYFQEKEVNEYLRLTHPQIHI